MASNSKLDVIRQECEQDLFTYAQMMCPERYFGDVHAEMFRFFQNSLERGFKDGSGDNACALVPRDHQKSYCIAVALSWVVTKYPWITCLYISSNPDLAEQQLDVIKNVFTSKLHRELWPEMLNYERGRTGVMEHKPKGTWTKDRIEIDHPDRSDTEKDPTILATSARSTSTGAHAKICVFDDLVTNENYDTESGRQDVRKAYQKFVSVLSTGAIKWAVGTRYGDDDLYEVWKGMSYPIYDDDSGDLIETKPTWRFFERKVEDSFNMDGSGQYVWPRQKMPSGQWFGFNRNELAKKKSEVEDLNLELFYCQYYNTANATATDKIGKDHFMYANTSALENRNGTWYYGEKPLKLHSAMDLNFTEGLGLKNKKKKDYTAISVIAWDSDGYLYVLEQRRFQTDKPEKYYKELVEMYDYWGFKETTVESNVGGSVVVRFIKDEIRKEGRSLVINGVPSTQNKNEKIALTLEPLYRTNSVYHFKGGYTRLLEEELRLTRPPHDDLKDSLTIAVMNSKRQGKAKLLGSGTNNRNVVNASCRFGGTRTRRRA